MKVDYLNPFLNSIVQIVQSQLYENPQRGRIYLRTEYPYHAGEVAIIVGITGAVQGQVALSMSRSAALAAAARMMMEDALDDLDEYAQSALSEMANMITANATIALADAGFSCDITPPSLIVGSDIQISPREGIKTIVIPLELTVGAIEVNLSLEEAPAGAQAMSPN
jgi:chemotaxis protein CheX